MTDESGRGEPEHPRWHSYDADDRLRVLINREIDTFSKDVLYYDRNNPGSDEKPGELNRIVSERMRARDAGIARTRKYIGASVGSIATILLTATVTTMWPWFLKLLGK